MPYRQPYPTNPQGRPVISELLAAAISLFLLEPFEAGMRERMAAARTSEETVRIVTDCVRRAGPMLVERAIADPAAMAATATRLMLGTITPERILSDLDPGCATGFEAVGPLLQG